jgi:DNA-binding response OmpR family regulator
MAKVLVINDETDLVDIVAIVLRAAGHEVKACTEGLAAVDVARGYQPTIIVLDWTLRGTDGGHVLSCLRADEATRSIPVIMMSASQEGPSRAREAGADAFLPKPFVADKLIELVTAVLMGSPEISASPSQTDNRSSLQNRD